MSVFYVILSLVFLGFSKNQLVLQITRFIRFLGGTQYGVIIVWSIIFLPGTIIHEVSHFLVAAFTGARTGRIEIFPEYLEEDVKGGKNSVTLGYVQTQTLNPIQGFLVGVAPFVSGIILLVYLTSLIQDAYLAQNYRRIIIEGYFFFTIANSFFPSWSDIKQALPLVVISLVALAAAWLLGFQVLYSLSPEVNLLIDSLTVSITASVGINLVLIAILMIINKLPFYGR